MIFPVKFPVCREFGWRPVRSALRRQPGIHAFGRAFQEPLECAGNPGFSHIWFRLRTPSSPTLRLNRRKSPARSANIPALRRLSMETGLIATAAQSALTSQQQLTPAAQNWRGIRDESSQPLVDRRQ